MVMLHLVKQLDISFGVAHCNFQLRGQESDEDAQFVKTSAEMLGIPFFMARFETTAYAEENKLSIQMAARELRYTWFENIRKTHGYSYIATAHNSDDSVETFFINLSRGCGLDGLTGIKPKSGSIIRPLLFASRELISNYARRKGVSFREDSSNASDKYLRNYIRHNVLPVLDEAHSNFRKGIHTTIQNLISDHNLYNHLISGVKGKIVSKQDENIYINIEELQKLPEVSGFLWEILNTFSFNRGTCFEIAAHLEGQPGKIFLSPTHRLIKDRTHLIVTKLHKQDNQQFYLEPDNIPEGLPFEFSMSVEDCNDDLLISRDALIATLDFNLLQWPLVLRKWQQGDYFAPLGMENLKKISDFLIDQKLSLYEKENTWVIESGNRICWVVGRRIDHRFRIKETTGKVLKVNIVRPPEM
jgi:tRNA(Ile)-lysidine synthase